MQSEFWTITSIVGIQRHYVIEVKSLPKVERLRESTLTSESDAVWHWQYRRDKVYNIIHSVYCDFCHLYIPTYVHEFCKVTNYPYARTPVRFQ